ncbi:VOC family protein [Mesorhizobium sp. NBSH29]|uniref:VOC family protein n=1 Tax=Mesorhizobium sp. NBSH29 TaxID=2654249 RepID=UPI00189657A7|nr:VOC family protein [Mesorhizobium sp. NBSH29]QPC87772.1 VOC family protein [Mesorhizobium sp. NBSH29]
MALPIDHLVLPVDDLSIARSRYCALGFTVAAQGVHPFGTVNACVYLGGGTFLEPLAIGDPDAAEAAVQSGNVFVARDRTFRTVHGPEGFSALVLGTNNAVSDDARYRQADISAGPLLDFERPFVDGHGRSDVAAFRLAFAAERGSEGTFFFACERVNVPQVDRAALERHDNGVLGLLGVVLAAAQPSQHCAFLESMSRGVAVADASGGLSVDAGNAYIVVATPSTLAVRFGIEVGPGGLMPCAARFGVANIDAAERLFKAGGIDYERRETCLVVPRAPGQGTAFIFEAA